MAQASKIEWTDATWNPTRGCSRVSEGCRHCYAERQAYRYSLTQIAPFYGFVGEVNGHPAWTGKVELIESKLAEPLRWKAPRRIFVNSMSDLFHEALPDEAIDRVFAVMALSPQHTFQILTKRPERMLNYCRAVDLERLRYWMNLAADGGEHRRGAYNLTSIAHRTKKGTEFEFVRRSKPPLPNVWLGVSIEDQATADQRIPFLLQTPAAIRFVSYEPALELVDFTRLYGKITIRGACDLCVDALSGKYAAAWRGRKTPLDRNLSELGAAKLDWVIVGGESGRYARPFDVECAIVVRNQCRLAGTACFLKQFGARPGYYRADGWRDILLNDRKGGGDMAEWPEDLRVREFPIQDRRN